MLAGIIILTLAIIAAITLGGMAFVMTMEAFGILVAVAATAVLAVIAILVWLGFAATIAVPILSIAALVLLGLSLSMMIGAIIGRRGTVTSWPHPQEQQFANFERRNSGSQSTAWMVGLGSAAAVFVFFAGVYFGVEPERKDISKTMNMSNLTKKQKSVDAPKPEAPKVPDAPAPAPAPAPETK